MDKQVLRNAKNDLPIISAGETAKVLSRYIDKYGNEALVLPNWMVSLDENEQVIWGENQAGLVLYYMNALTAKRWYSKAAEKEIGRESFIQNNVLERYDQIVWIPITDSIKKMLEIKDNLPIEQKIILNRMIEYGGFYISRYTISNSKQRSSIFSYWKKSVYGYLYTLYRTFENAKEVAEEFKDSFCDNYLIASYLPFGWEYDLIKQCILKGKNPTMEERRFYYNIYMPGGEGFEWTQERGIKNKHITRGSFWESWKKPPYPTDCLMESEDFEKHLMRAIIVLK